MGGTPGVRGLTKINKNLNDNINSNDNNYNSNSRTKLVKHYKIMKLVSNDHELKKEIHTVLLIHQKKKRGTHVQV